MRDLRQRVQDEIAKVVVGQAASVDALLGAALVGGHVLLEGVPGTAKTLLAKAFARSLGLGFGRTQFTPDMLPSDVTGGVVLTGGELRFRPGPVFTNLLLADEVNRTPPKTQAALLEAMGEGQVTVDGKTHPLPEPFMVVATQNPIEYEGTYPLPEAQLDRFLLEIDVGYPEIEAERRMMTVTTGLSEETPPAVFDGAGLIAAQRIVRQVPVGEKVAEAILTLVRAGRPETSDVPEVQAHVAWGPGPRASQALMLASRARAVLDGRLAPSVDDIVALADPVLRHRMALNFAARAEGVTIEQIIARLVEPLR